MPVVVLRPVQDDDLPVFFEHQADPAATVRAVASARTREEHDAWWARVRGNSETVVRTVVVDGEVAGWIASFAHDGGREIGGWSGPAMWGRGAGTEALRQLLEIDGARPIRAGTAPSNAAAARVLKKAGFVAIGTDPADGFVLYELA